MWTAARPCTIFTVTSNDIGTITKSSALATYKECMHNARQTNEGQQSIAKIGCATTKKSVSSISAAICTISLQKPFDLTINNARTAPAHETHVQIRKTVANPSLEIGQNQRPANHTTSTHHSSRHLRWWRSSHHNWLSHHWRRLSHHWCRLCHYWLRLSHGGCGLLLSDKTGGIRH